MKRLLGPHWSMAFVAQALVLSMAAGGYGKEPTITVSGSAEVRVVPDLVVITAGVETRAETVPAASKDNAAKIKAILTQLKQAGVEEKHIRTDYLSITPIMDDQQRYLQKGAAQQQSVQSNSPFDADADSDEESPLEEKQPIGYLVSRQFAITIVDLKKFEEIYQALIEAGVNRIQGIEFRSSEMRKHRDQARLEAVRAAREKAQAMAGELGAKVASVKTIDETSDEARYGRLQNSISDDPFAPAGIDEEETFAAGQIAITASVQIVFVLSDTELEE